MSFETLRQYLNGPFASVHGWCIPHLWQSIQPLAERIAARGDAGPIAEIGVFQGKFFIGLVKTMNAVTQNYAIDVFDMQEFNLDNAGHGSLQALENNLARCSVDRGAVRVLRTDSLWLGKRDTDRIFAETGGFSMFSIDGCHLVAHTLNDMQLAFDLTRPDGIIFVDDYYNPSWPGVQEAVAKYYLNNSARFVPLLFSCGKLFLCNLSFHATYLETVARFLSQHFPSTAVKRVQRFGFETLTVMPDHKSNDYLF